jgi:hypothetical protein
MIEKSHQNIIRLRLSCKAFLVLLFFFSLFITACDGDATPTSTPKNPSPSPPPITQPTKSATIPPTTSTPTTTLAPSPTTVYEPTSPSIETPTQFIKPTSTIKPIPTRTPKYSSDLLYIHENVLTVWDHVTNDIFPISEGTYEYSIDNSGREIAIIRSKNIVANGIELFELVKLDKNTLEEFPIIESTPRLYNLSLSPNGLWVTITPNLNGGRILAIKTDGSDQVKEIGFCHQTFGNACPPVAWSPDSRSIIWSDQRGVWFTKLDWDSPQLITQNLIQVTDPEGQLTELTVTFNSFVWSPLGRFVLSRIVPSTGSTQWYTIIDTSRKLFFPIPSSFQSGTLTSNVGWLNDGKLLIGNGKPQNSSPSMVIEIFKVIPTQADLLYLQNRISLPLEMLPKPLDTSKTSWSYVTNWIHPSSTGSIYFGIDIAEDNTSPILFYLIPEKKYLETINRIPSNISDVLWALDNSGALLISEDGEIFFQAIDGGMLSNLTQILGEGSENLIWLPSSLRLARR